MAILSTQKSAKCPPRLQSGTSILNNCTARAFRRQPTQLSIDFGDPNDRPIDPPHPLQIEAVPIEERIRPDLSCRIVHARSGYRVPGSFTYSEGAEILDRTRGLDFTLDDKRRPACSQRLLALLEQVAGTDSGDRPVRAIGGGTR